MSFGLVLNKHQSGFQKPPPPTSFGLTYSPVTNYAKSPSIKSLTHPLKSLIQSSTQISLRLVTHYIHSIALISGFTLNTFMCYVMKRHHYTELQSIRVEQTSERPYRMKSATKIAVMQQTRFYCFCVQEAFTWASLLCL